MGQLVCDTMIVSRSKGQWKHAQSIRQNYAGAPYVEEYSPELEHILNSGFERLVDLNHALIDWFWRKLDINCITHRASLLGVEENRQDRLLRICQLYKANTYPTGDSAWNYLDFSAFERSGIRIKWQKYEHTVYRHYMATSYLLCLPSICF